MNYSPPNSPTPQKLPMASLPFRRRVHDRPPALLGRFGEDPEEGRVKRPKVTAEVGVAESGRQVVEGDGGRGGVVLRETRGERAGEEDLQEFGYVVAV